MEFTPEIGGLNAIPLYSTATVRKATVADQQKSFFDALRHSYLPQVSLPPQGDHKPPSALMIQRMVQQVEVFEIKKGIKIEQVEQAKELSVQLNGIANEVEAQITRAEAEHSAFYIQAFHPLSTAMVGLMKSDIKAEEFQQIKTSLHTRLMSLKEKAEITEEERFELLKGKLGQLIEKYNALITLKEDVPLEGRAAIEEMEMAAKQAVDRLRAKLSEKEMTTSSHRVFEGKWICFQAMVEKRMALLEKKFELDLRIAEKSIALVDRFKRWRVESQLKSVDQSRSIDERKQILEQYHSLYNEIHQDSSAAPALVRDIGKKLRRLNYLVKQLQKVEEKLSQTPSLEFLDKIGNNIVEGLRQPSHTIDPSSMRTLYRLTEQQMQWGKDYLNMALAHPVHWSTMHRAALKISQSGRLYASISELQPMKKAEEWGVPAGLRADGRFHERPANFHKTVNYLLGHEEETATVSFRGGQLPTPAAAERALTDMMLEVDVDGFHINGLLTPTLSLFKPDKNLLKNHEKNIKAALAGLYANFKNAELQLEEAAEKKRAPPVLDPVVAALRARGYTAEKIALILKQNAISNFGVNEGAVGEKRIFTKALRAGWHTCIGKYDNHATGVISTRIQNKLDELDKKLATDQALSEGDLKLIDRLGAIVQFGQNLEAIWANNDYAQAAVGNDQFKLPAGLKVLDLLVGIVVYSHCMSGKDRTGEEEVDSQRQLDEIHMNLIELKKQLPKEVSLACFSPDELKGRNKIDSELRGMIRAKLRSAKMALGWPERALFTKKKIIPLAVALTDTVGISTNAPLASNPEAKKAACAFPGVVPPSVYDHPLSIEKQLEQHQFLHEFLEDPAYQAQLQNRQRLAENCRQTKLNSGMLTITERNGGKPGTKIEGGEPFRIYSSGFDRDYLIFSLLKAADSYERRALFTNLTALHELDAATQLHLLSRFDSISAEEPLELVKNYTALLREVEKAKLETSAPLGHVAA